MSIEDEIISATRLFAEHMNVHYDAMTEGIIRNALREYKKKLESKICTHELQWELKSYHGKTHRKCLYCGKIIG